MASGCFLLLGKGALLSLNNGNIYFYPLRTPWKGLLLFDTIKHDRYYSQVYHRLSAMRDTDNVQ